VRRRALIPAGVIVVLALTAGAGRAQVHDDAARPLTPPLVAGSFQDRGDGVLWEARLREPDATYLRLRFEAIVVPPDSDLVVTVRAADGTALARYTGAELTRHGSWYTDVLPTDAVRVQVTGTPPLGGVSFAITEIVRGVPQQVIPQSVVSTWLDVARARPRFRDELLASVAKLFIGSAVTCTGFLVGPQAILTNFHCLDRSPAFRASQGRPAPDCSDIAIHFDFDRQPAPDAVIRARCARVLKFDQALDYALLDLGSPPAQGATVRAPLPLADQGLAQAGQGHLVHHPAGLAKKVSIDCDLQPAVDGRIEHRCSTLGGSSGAPLLDDTQRVIGLHHEGAYPPGMTQEQIERLTGEGHVFWNKAKPSHLIREQLRSFLP
jgi:hypothetical protein